VRRSGLRAVTLEQHQAARAAAAHRIWSKGSGWGREERRGGGERGRPWRAADVDFPLGPMRLPLDLELWDAADRKKKAAPAYLLT
jgi:hypothetical protein